MKITLDANVIDADTAKLISEAEELGHEIVIASVTERERNNPEVTKTVSKIPEVFVFGESSLGVGALAADDDDETFENILSLISNGAFPPEGHREQLTQGEKRQLRDAMAFTSHVRDGRDIFVTDDMKGFIKNGRRDTLESTYETRIMAVSEFKKHLADVRSSVA